MIFFAGAMVLFLTDEQLESYYDLSYTIVSLIFLTPFAGYSVAAFTNARIHQAFGQRGVAIMAPFCHVITYIVLALHPPYPVLVVANTIGGFGNGLTDACFCAWVGAMDKANTIQGFLHSFYSIGALISPLIATSMVVKAELPWYNYYYLMVRNNTQSITRNPVAYRFPDWHVRVGVGRSHYRVLAEDWRSVPRGACAREPRERRRHQDCPQVKGHLALLPILLRISGRRRYAERCDPNFSVTNFINSWSRWLDCHLHAAGP